MLLLLLLAATPAPAPCTPDAAATIAPADAEAAIRQAETEWAASIATDEASFLRRMTAPGFTAVFDGEVTDRASLIDGATKRPKGTASDVLDDLRVHPSGAVAIAEGTETWRQGGRRRHIVWSDLWVHCGEWRLVTSTAAGTPAE